jgi:pantoate--beta-alanine ligase
MKVVETVAELQQLSRAWRAHGRGVGFVPTMGALHAGHLSLVEAASRPGDRVIASIFVNPLQFAAGEDLATYPRPFERDRRLLAAAGVDVLFHPSVAEMYPAGADTRVSPGPVALPLEGASRPGHFAGVATVVARLLNAALPDRAYFGQKDAQQLAVIRALVKDLAFPVEVIGCPTVREANGLAMSSRNGYLEPGQLDAALSLVRGLARAQRIGPRGRAGRVEAAIVAELRAHPGVKFEYAAVVNPETFARLDPSHVVAESSLAVVAARVGKARLIDNAWVNGKELARFVAPPLPNRSIAGSHLAGTGASAWNA